ncbi:hypothetical protein VNO78_21545 [Psophocarpus tetragonolobus]|uniref:Uncharacterized protein n=1 Tax=Psophocarpus tetragonolobus TaxID=3891 RepID=A0AAN9SBY2_PSOTE
MGMMVIRFVSASVGEDDWSALRTLLTTMFHYLEEISCRCSYKFCGRDDILIMIKGKGKPSTQEISESGKFSPLMLFDCRGHEPVYFVFSDGWKVESCVKEIKAKLMPIKQRIRASSTCSGLSGTQKVSCHMELVKDFMANGKLKIL